tara:strand:- start:223 stop:447 length:225 start_codon:yes stop_codon:yes gene_type:complete
MKYVRHKTKGMFIFPDSQRVWHAHVGKFLGREGLVSAGFVRFVDGIPECYGDSESLTLGGAEDDTQVARNMMGL